MQVTEFKFLDIPNSTAHAAEQLAAWSEQAQNPDFQCSPAMPVLSAELWQRYMESEYLTTLRFGPEDAVAAGYAIIEDASGRVLWLQTWPVDEVYIDCVEAMIDWIVTQHPTQNFVFGTVLNPHLRTLYERITYDGHPLRFGDEENPNAVYLH